MEKLSYKRILLKLSGERFGHGERGAILDVEEIKSIADEIIALKNAGIQVAVVLGGGNILRGSEAAASGIVEAQAHYMGMLATVINALALQSALEQKETDTRVMSALSVHSVCEPYIRRRALRHLEKERVVIFAGGTGNPFFTTDTAGALRAIEIGADLLVKATKVDGIYTADPKKDKTAKHIASASFKEVLVDDLKVMDGAAIAVCREHELPLMVCGLEGGDSILQALQGNAKCTLVHK